MSHLNSSSIPVIRVYKQSFLDKYMKKPERVDSTELLAAGLELMRGNGKALHRLESPGRSMIYSMPNGETVRARTCNDHVLIVVADRPSDDAKLNVEGTDWLLIVMPEVERQRGNVIAYLVPSTVAAEAARQTHRDWLATQPATKGANTTWNLWFRVDAPEKANNFAEKWSRYRLNGIRSTDHLADPSRESVAQGSIKAEVENARRRIAAAAGVPIEAVRITIDFGV